MRVPSVPIVVAETRKLAQEGSYRFFGAALVDAAGQGESTARLIALPGGGPVPPATAQVRAWARATGVEVPIGVGCGRRSGRPTGATGRD